MDQREILEFFAKRDRAWQDHDAEAIALSYTEDGALESPLWGNVHGKSALRKVHIEWFATFPDAEFYSEHLLVDGDRVAQFVKITGTQRRDFCGYPPTGKRFQIRGASLCFLRDGRIDREIRTYDFTGVLLQLGALKAKPAF